MKYMNDLCCGVNILLSLSQNNIHELSLKMQHWKLFNLDIKNQSFNSRLLNAYLNILRDKRIKLYEIGRFLYLINFQNRNLRVLRIHHTE